MSEFLRSDASHVPDLVADRGPTEYFHGRTRILSNFKDLLGLSKQDKGGTTFLIQGAPGAGKTALLDQCAKLAKGIGWKIVMLRPTALMDPEELLDRLGKGRRISITGGSGQVGVDAMIKAQGTLDFAFRHSARTMEKILQDGKKPLLLILDEAQALGLKDVVPADQKPTVTSILDYIHNGGAGRPVILLTAGLGMTSNALRSLGISRFRGGCFVELGALGKKAERAVIRDWLKREAGANGDPTAWIDAIARETQGWPQHIIAYTDAAVKQINKDNGAMTSTGLEVVYRLGMQRREAYYNQRAEEISRKERCSLARLITNDSIRDGLDKEDIVAALSQEYGPEKAQDLFNRTLERGMLHSQDGVYTIPIPSMHNWLVSNYVREGVEFPHAPQTSPALRERNPGRER